MRLFVGEKRKDGKTPVTLLYQRSGVRLKKLASDEALERYKAEADEGVFAASKARRR